MSPYVCALGKKVEVIYRPFGTRNLLAVGILLGFSDDHILIEQHYDRHGTVEPFPMVIRYSWIVRFKANEELPQYETGYEAGAP